MFRNQTLHGYGSASRLSLGHITISLGSLPTQACQARGTLIDTFLITLKEPSENTCLALLHIVSPLNRLDSILLEYGKDINIEQKEEERDSKGHSPCLKIILVSPPATGHPPSLLKPPNSTYNCLSLFLQENCWTAL